MQNFAKPGLPCRLLLVFSFFLISACSSQPPQAGLVDPSEPSFNNPGTLPTETTSSASDYLLDIGTTVAFLDSCISDSGLVGPCHCAAEILANDVDSSDVAALEDRMSAYNEFPVELAGLLVQCRGAERPPVWSSATKEIYLAACAQNSERLSELCRCSASRAADVIPEERLPEFLKANDLSPSMVDFINTCL